jgi:hypothetical protein
MNKQEISENIESTIRIAVNTTALHHYMQHKYKWSDSTIDQIDWMLLGQSLRLLSTNQRKTITQFMHEWLPVRGHPGRADCQSNRTCPSCSATPETQTHFLECINNQDKWNKAITEAIQPLQEKYAAIADIIRWALINSRSSDPAGTTELDQLSEHPNNHQYALLIKAQTAIGWQHILKGRWATTWVNEIEKISPGQGEKEMTNITISI